MTLCPKCNTEWEPDGCRLRLCRSCRRDLPVRRVNVAPLDRRYMRHLRLDAGEREHHLWVAYRNDKQARFTSFRKWRNQKQRIK